MRVVPYGKLLAERSRTWHRHNTAAVRIYEGRTLEQYRAAVSSLERMGYGLTRLNALRSVIDTFVSRIAKDRPMPSIISDDGDWEMKRRAHSFRAFVVGQMRETEFDDLSREGLNDASIMGNGFTRIDDGADSVYAERMLVNEVLFDERECRYGKPHQALHVRRVARDYLCELFPDARDSIVHAEQSLRRPDERSTDQQFVGNLDDYVDVYEAWHLPSLPESEDGLHVVCISNCTLDSERWEEPRFPWVHWRLVKPNEGLFGLGFVDDLADLQHEINTVVRDIQLNMRAAGRGYYLVNEQNDMPVELLSAARPFKITYRGSTPPQFNAPPPFSQASLNMLSFYIDKMYDLSGVSRAAAESKSTLGAGASGIALDTQYDIDSDRFRQKQANFARGRLDGAQCYLDAAARVHRKRKQESGRKRSWIGVSWNNRDAIERLDFNDVAMERDQYRLQIEPVNFLPDTRAGKLSAVDQLARAGVIPQWLVPTLFNEPDLVQANGIILAPFRNCMRKMDILCNTKKQAPTPEPFNDLELELKIVTAYCNRVQEEGAPDEVQERFEIYRDQVLEMIERKGRATAQPAAPEMAPAEMPLPGGVPLMPTAPVPQPAMIGAAA